MDYKGEFFCPVYEGKISKLECASICTGIHMGNFINDNFSLLMDVETALNRKYRCFLCHNSSHYNHPSGPHLAATLWNLGFSSDFFELEYDLIKLENKFPYNTYRDGNICNFYLPSGIQIWGELNSKTKIIRDIQPHFFSSNAMYLGTKKIIKYNAVGQKVRSLLVSSAHNIKNEDNRLVINGFVSPNLSIYPEDFVNKEDFVAQVTAFPGKIFCFEDKETYLEKREIKLAEQSFVSGLSMPDADEKNPGADALITGIIEKVNILDNDITGKQFYHIELKCLNLVFDVVASIDKFENKPKPGNVIQARFWLSARILDYGYTGYNFETYLTLPITLNRFTPIGCLLYNLQPGEKIYCGIDPPIEDIIYIRAKAEVEGISVEFGLDPQDEDTDENKTDTEKQDSFRIFRFYPVSKKMAHKIFFRTLVHVDPPYLGDAKDVTEEYI